ncbi:hypothetical protein BZA70DRAFT_175698 [Myxozyma melibiosi]|uniref:Uncharacterized protein n=1 Tax=Myxozyma melibiosi TaxID=54550 RepID=A0ABR1F5T2_9ASCO
MKWVFSQFLFCVIRIERWFVFFHFLLLPLYVACLLAFFGLGISSSAFLVVPSSLLNSVVRLERLRHLPQCPKTTYFFFLILFLLPFFVYFYLTCNHFFCVNRVVKEFLISFLFIHLSIYLISLCRLCVHSLHLLGTF